MSSSDSRHALQINGKLLASGAALLCVGGAVLTVGPALSANGLAQATQKWLDQLEESPSEMAQRRIHQLKVAAEAGTKAWRDQSA